MSNSKEKPIVTSGGGPKEDWQKASDLEGQTNYLIKDTDEYRYRAIFAFLPVLLGKKFRWFKKVIVKERKYIVKKEIMDMWNVPGWSKPYEEWRKEEIVEDGSVEVSNEDTYKDEKNGGWVTIAMISLLVIMFLLIILIL